LAEPLGIAHDLDADDLAMSKSSDTRATTVVNHPVKFDIPVVSARLRRSHVSCTASSASLMEPSMRYATDRKCARSASNRSTKNSLDRATRSIC
jgi:hypothetical protein